MARDVLHRVHFFFQGLVEVSFVNASLEVVEGDSLLEVCVEMFLPSGKELGFDITVSLTGTHASMEEKHF